MFPGKIGQKDNFSSLARQKFANWSKNYSENIQNKFRWADACHSDKIIRSVQEELRKGPTLICDSR